MAKTLSAKAYWPNDLKNFCVGGDGYLLVSFADDFYRKLYEVDTVKDVTLNFSTSTVDATCRRSGRWKENLPVVNELSVDAEMLFEYGAKDVKVAQRLLKAAQRNEIVKVGAFTVDGNGPWFYACVTDMSRPEALEDVVKLSSKYSLSRFIRWYDALDDEHPITVYEYSAAVLEAEELNVVYDAASATVSASWAAPATANSYRFLYKTANDGVGEWSSVDAYSSDASVELPDAARGDVALVAAQTVGADGSVLSAGITTYYTN